MDKAAARELVESCLPRFQEAGLSPIKAESIIDVQVRRIASLWAGMGSVYRLTIESKGASPVSIVAKRVELPAACASVGDQRKKHSYNVEAAFYSKGHAKRLIQAGARVPFPLHVDNSRSDGMTICMTQLDGMHSVDGDHRSFMIWLARLHATYWGERADEACGLQGGGLQEQGCYWHLDTRLEEHDRMSSKGWMGRLKRAARAIDLRLKADRLQSVCHGDAKGANILYTQDGGAAAALVYDFQYCGKAAVTKDLAYFFNVEASPSEVLRSSHGQFTPPDSLLLERSSSHYARPTPLAIYHF